MSKSNLVKDIPKYKKIRQYVISLAVQAKDKDLKLMSERKLSRYFNVNRITVRRALEQLRAEGMIYSRQSVGTFVNKERKNSRLYVGIIYGNGKTANFSGGISIKLGTALCELGEKNILTRIPNLINEGIPVADELASYNFDGILWIAPHISCFEAIERLHDMKIPTVAASLPRVDKLEPDPGNRVTVDIRKGNEMIADHLIKRGHRSIVFLITSAPGFTISRNGKNVSYLSDSRFSFEVFAERFHAKVPDAELFLLNELDNLDVKLDNLWEEHHFTAIVSGGSYERMEAAAKLLRKHENIDFVFDKYRDWTIDYRSIHQAEARGLICDPMEKRIVATAADKLVESMNSGKNFPSVFIPPKLKKLNLRLLNDK